MPEIVEEKDGWKKARQPGPTLRVYPVRKGRSASMRRRRKLVKHARIRIEFTYWCKAEYGRMPRVIMSGNMRVTAFPEPGEASSFSIANAQCQFTFHAEK